jgi:hypothetical protein
MIVKTWKYKGTIIERHDGKTKFGEPTLLGPCYITTGAVHGLQMNPPRKPLATVKAAIDAKLLEFTHFIVEFTENSERTGRISIFAIDDNLSMESVISAEIHHLPNEMSAADVCAVHKQADEFIYGDREFFNILSGAVGAEMRKVKIRKTGALATQ